MAQNSSKKSIEQLMISADMAQKNGDLTVAESLYTEALAQAESDDDLFSQYEILGDLVDVYAKLHNPEKGVELMAKQAVISNKLPGADYDLRLIESMHMPLFIAKIGNRDLAMECLDIVEAYAKRANTDFGYGMYHMTKGWTLIILKDWAHGVDCFFSACDYFSKSDSEYSASFFEITLQLMADCYGQLGLYQGALELYDELFDLIESTKGSNHIDYAVALGLCANIRALSGDIDGGANQYITAWETLRVAVTRELNALRPSERGILWNNVEYLVWKMASYGLHGGQQQNRFTSAGYEALVFGKGFMLSAERSTEDQVLTTHDPDLISDYYSLASLKSEVDALVKNKKSNDLAHKYAIIDSLDQSVTARLLSYGFEPVVKSISAREIADALSEGEAIVDFTDFKGVNSDIQFYAAYVMRKEYEHPQLVLVFKEHEIRELLDEVNGRYSSLCDKRMSPKLWAKVWQPLMPYLEGIDNVYFVPSGILYNIPIEAITMDDGATLGEKYNIKRLTSSKEIINYNSKLNYPRTATLYGGLDYDVEPEIMASAAKLTPKIDNLWAMRGGIDEARGDSIFRKLKHSEAEVTEIDRILTQNNVVTTKRMKTEGTEESFMGMHGNSPDMLLLSTHGFYYSPGKVPSWSSLNGYDNAMYLTGLVMSGGNAEWMGRYVPDGVMGGLLTSADISLIDLSNTQMVVLSACETGLGRATNEGVYGLQRAFKKAGAKTLVMSLWPVIDVVAKEFMIEFHNQLAINQWDKRNSFMEAQRKLRQKYTDPYYWASFIMVD